MHQAESTGDMTPSRRRIYSCVSRYASDNDRFRVLAEIVDGFANGSHAEQADSPAPGFANGRHVWRDGRANGGPGAVGFFNLATVSAISSNYRFGGSNRLRAMIKERWSIPWNEVAAILSNSEFDS